MQEVYESASVLGKYTKPHVVLGSIIWGGVREHLSSDRRAKLGIHLVITDIFLLEVNLLVPYSLLEGISKLL